LVYPQYSNEDDKSTNKPKETLNRLLGKVLIFDGDDNLNNEEWINSQKDKIEPDIIIKTYDFICLLAEKFQIDLNAENKNNNNEGERKND